MDADDEDVAELPGPLEEADVPVVEQIADHVGVDADHRLPGLPRSSVPRSEDCSRYRSETAGPQGVEQWAIRAEDVCMGRDLGESVPRRRSPIVNVMGTYGTQVAGAVLGLVNVLIVSRSLGPEGRGNVAFLLTMAMLVSQLSNLGVQSSVMNFGGRDRKLLPTLAGTSVAVSLVLGGLAMGVVAGLIELFPAVGGHTDVLTRWIALGCVPALVLSYYLYMVALVEYRFAVSNIVILLGPVGSALTNLVLAATGELTVRGAVVAWAGGQVLGLIVIVWYIHRRLDGFGRADYRLSKSMVGFGVKTHAGQIGMVGNYRLDQWLLGSISGPKALGLYSVAVAWSEVLFFLPNALATVQRPDLVRADREGASRQASVGFRAGALLT